MAAAIKLVWTGIAMGVVHVLTGPDHVSALATLSSSASSSSSPEASKCYLFGLGARWGIGHSTGLLLVGGIFVFKDILQNGNGNGNDENENEGDETNNHQLIPDAVTRLFESFVGVFMLLLGFYGIYEARRIRYNEYSYSSIDPGSGGIDNNIDIDIDVINNTNDTIPNISIRRESESVSSTSNSNTIRKRGISAVAPFEMEATETHRRPDYESTEDDLEEFRYNLQVVLGTVSTGDANADANADANTNALGGGTPPLNHHQHHHHHHNDHSNSPFLALCAGIFHGLAGPGGVLGVVPAIQLHDAGLAACYLLSFCASSTVTMGTFAAAYGTFTASLAACISRRQRQRNNRESNKSARSVGIGIGGDGLEGNGGDDDDGNGNGIDDDSLEAISTRTVEFWIRCFSASMSVLVGVVWLVLLAMGKLEDVFG